MWLRNGQKKSPRNIWKLSGKVLIFAPASREKRFSGALERVLKNFEKSSEIFWRFENLPYLCTRFR